jgi:hypothetical protein
MNALKYKALEEPGLTAAGIAILLGLLLRALASYGLSLTPETEELLNALVMVLFPVVAAAAARWYTTPLIRPQDNDGNALTPDEFITP